MYGYRNCLVPCRGHLFFVLMLSDRLLRHVLSFDLRATQLPQGIGVLDPFKGGNSDQVKRIVTEFHRKYYNDDRSRLLMLGINPGRLGAGSTGLPFTDAKRCEGDLGIPVTGMRTHEPSSDFFYRMTYAAGWPRVIYSRIYVHAMCPPGFARERPGNKPINLSHYADLQVDTAVMPFTAQWLKDVVA